MLMLSGQIDQLTRLKREAAIKMGDTDPALIWPATTCWAIANLGMNEKNHSYQKNAWTMTTYWL